MLASMIAPSLPPAYSPTAPSFSRFPPPSFLPGERPTNSAQDELALVIPAPGSPLVTTSPSPVTKRLTDLLEVEAKKGEKANISMTTTEGVIFVMPSPSTNDAADGSEEGQGSRVSGAIRVFLPSRRFVERVSVRLVVTERLAFPGESKPEDTVLLKKELNYRGEKSNPAHMRAAEKGFWMDAGATFFEFAFAVPSCTPGRDISPNGRTVCHLHANLFGLDGGRFSSPMHLEQTQEVFIFVNEYLLDPAGMQLSYFNEANDPYLGPRSVSLFSNTFTISSPLSIDLKFTSLPPNLTILAISAFVRQTRRLTSSRVPGKTALVTSSKRVIAHQGPMTGFTEKGFVERARAKGGEAVVLDVEKAGLAGGSWTWSQMGRMPSGNDDFHRPTTSAGTRSNLRFGSELVVEVFYHLSDVEGPEANAVRVVPMFKRNVALHSCFCTEAFLDLPDYSDSAKPVRHRRHWDESLPCPVGCACDLSWEVLETRENVVKKRLQEEADLGMAKRLSNELNGMRYATDGDGLEWEVAREEEKRVGGCVRLKVGEMDEYDLI